MRVVQIDLISVWGIEVDLIPVKDEIDLVAWNVENGFISVWRIGIALVFM